MQVGSRVKLKDETSALATHIGEVVRIEPGKSGGRIWYWCIFPGHPWQVRCELPFGFEAHELEEEHPDAAT